MSSAIFSFAAEKEKIGSKAGWKSEMTGKKD
jgi:hypothetical protein